MPTKVKTTPKTGVKAKRDAIAKAFGAVPVVDPQHVDFLYSRRHLATVPGRLGPELQYIVEFDDLEKIVSETLARIRQRDGTKIFREVADRLIGSVTADVDIVEGKWNDIVVAGRA